MCIVLFCTFPCRCCTTRKQFSYFCERKIHQHFTKLNWKWWDKRNGVWNNVNENLFFQVTVLLWSPSWLLKLPNISLSLLNNRSKATKDIERRWTELRQYMEPDNHISVPGPSEDSVYKKPSIKVCPHFLLYKPFSPCLALLYFALLYCKFLINAKIRRKKDKSNRIKLLGIIFFVFFTRYMYVHFVIIRIPKENLWFDFRDEKAKLKDTKKILRILFNIVVWWMLKLVPWALT